MRYTLPKVIVAVLISTLALSACRANTASDRYSSTGLTGKVVEGTIISARPVTVEGKETLLGALGGGVAGGVAGSTLGKGKGSTLGATAGVVAGALVGSAIEKAVSESDGIEYIVRLDKKYINSVPTNVETSAYKSSNVDKEIQQSVTVEQTSTDLVSVVQDAKDFFNVGDRVLIIYNNDRPRLVASR